MTADASFDVDLLLVRHGNTFAPGDRIVWVGKNEDMPLVPSGRDQAAALRVSLEAAGWMPDTALAGALKRQREHIQIATADARPITPAPELDEVDYGAWGGLTTDEIEARFGREELDAWNERSAVPTGAGWPETADDLRTRVRGLAERIAAGEYGSRVLACSSNGLIRWFLELVEGGFENAVEGASFKVKTGHTCRLGYTRGSAGSKGCWSVLHWNQPPGAALACLSDAPRPPS